MVAHDEKEIKRRIRAYKRLKRKTRVGTATRREINYRIRELKEQLNKVFGKMTPKKEELITKIYKTKPLFKILSIDLRKFTEAELQYYFDTKIIAEEIKNKTEKEKIKKLQKLCYPYRLILKKRFKEGI